MIAGELKRIIEGPVPESEEHIAISYGSVDTDKSPYPIVARVSAPRDGGINLDFLITESTTRDAEVMAAVRRQVHWLFLEKNEADPWACARYHCTTGANVYSRVHWGWVSGTPNPER